MQDKGQTGLGAREGSIVLLVAAAVGLMSLAYYSSQQLTTVHYDAKAHLVVARRLTDSQSPGYGQMGIHWLPLIHLVYWPLVLSDGLYRSAFLPSLVSVFSFAASAWLVFRIAKRLSGSRFGGLMAGLILIANSNLQYLQSCPMTEPVFMALMLAAVDALISWRESGGAKPPWRTAVWSSLGAICRYEGWLISIGIIGLVCIDALKNRSSRARSIGAAILVGTTTAIPLLAHFGFAYLRTSDTFVHRVVRGNPGPAGTHKDLLLSAVYHLGELGQIAGVIPLVAGVCGVLYVLARSRPLLRWAPMFLLWLPSLVNIAALYWGMIYRVRYSVLLVPAISVFTGILVRSEIALRRSLLSASLAAMTLPWVSAMFPREWEYHALFPGPGILWLPLFALLAFMTGWGWRSARVPLLALCVLSSQVPVLDGEDRPILDETLEHQGVEPMRQRVISYLRASYDGTLILLDIEKHAPLVYDSGLAVREFLYNEGDLVRWRRALEDPRQEAGWICAQPGDEVWPLLQVDPPWKAKYSLAVRTEVLHLYRLHREEREWLRRNRPSP